MSSRLHALTACLAVATFVSCSAAIAAVHSDRASQLDNRASDPRLAGPDDGGRFATEALGFVVMDMSGHILRSVAPGLDRSRRVGLRSETAGSMLDAAVPDVALGPDERLALAWRLEGDPAELAALPGEMRVRDAAGDDLNHVTVYEVIPAAPRGPVARVPALAARTVLGHASSRAADARHVATPGPSVGSPAPAPSGIADPCLDPCLLYSGDPGGRLYSIDPVAGTSIFIGAMTDIMFDIAASTDQQLYGMSSSGQLYRINACNAALTPIGFGGGGNGLAGDPASNDLFSQGPPLRRIDTPGATNSAIGGSAGGAPPFWCGFSSGDLSASPADGMLYSSVAGGSCGCPGDALIKIDPATGNEIARIGCFTNSMTLAPLSGVYGLAHLCDCRLYAAQSFGSIIYVVDPLTALATPIPVTGGFNGTNGIAAIPPVACGVNDPPTCGPTADAPSCGTTTLHANAADPDGDTLTYAWSSSDCPDATFTPGADVSDPEVHVEPACRTCVFDLAVDDGHSHTCTGSVTVVFTETTPPTISASTLVACLWSPNHQFVDVGLATVATGGCGGAVTVAVTSVTSDEPTATMLGAGGASHCPDAIVDGMTVYLRAERSGFSDGRIYHIGVTATDACGNTVSGLAEVRVPHDQDPKTPGQTGGNDPDGPCPAVDSGGAYDATGCN